MKSYQRTSLGNAYVAELVEQQLATRCVVCWIPAGGAFEVWPWTSVLNSLVGKKIRWASQVLSGFVSFKIHATTTRTWLDHCPQFDPVTQASGDLKNITVNRRAALKEQG
jgi:hypothetical protein